MKAQQILSSEVQAKHPGLLYTMKDSWMFELLKPAISVMSQLSQGLSKIDKESEDRGNK